MQVHSATGFAFPRASGCSKGTHKLLAPIAGPTSAATSSLLSINFQKHDENAKMKLIAGN